MMMYVTKWVKFQLARVSCKCVAGCPAAGVVFEHFARDECSDIA